MIVYYLPSTEDVVWSVSAFPISPSKPRVLPEFNFYDMCRTMSGCLICSQILQGTLLDVAQYRVAGVCGYTVDDGSPFGSML